MNAPDHTLSLAQFIQPSEPLAQQYVTLAVTSALIDCAMGAGLPAMGCTAALMARANQRILKAFPYHPWTDPQSDLMSICLKSQNFSLSCRAFPKDTVAAYFPLRVPNRASSVGLSLHIGDTALTGRDGFELWHTLWWLYVRARLRAPELLNSAGPSTHVQLPPFCLTAERWQHQ